MKLFSKQYYYLIAGLPELQFDESKPGLTLFEFREELKNQLSESDYKLVEKLFLIYDHDNILRFLTLKEENFDELGNFTINHVTESPENGVLPNYIVDFIHDYSEKKNDNPDYDWNLELTTRYYSNLLNVDNEFLQEYFLFDLHLQNTLTAFYGKKHNIDVSNQLVGDDYIIQQLRKSQSKDYGLSAEFPEIEGILQIADIENVVEREKKIDLLRWDYINNKTFFHYFSIEKVLGYLIQLMIVARWLKLDKNTGREMFKMMVETMKNAYEFPDEFKVNR